MDSPMENAAIEQPRKITFRFCRECSNMLYPKENKDSHTLSYACRTCNFAEPATSSCVYRNELSNTIGETAGITQDVGSDPTVGDLPFCTLCGQEIACAMCESVGNAATNGEWGLNMDGPELPRSNKQCPACDQTEAVFFQSQQRTAETGMKLFYVCCNCGNVWQ